VLPNTSCRSQKVGILKCKSRAGPRRGAVVLAGPLAPVSAHWAADARLGHYFDSSAILSIIVDDRVISRSPGKPETDGRHLCLSVWFFIIHPIPSVGGRREPVQSVNFFLFTKTVDKYSR